MTDYDVYDHKDVQASCMDLDVAGRKIVLAGKKCIAITDATYPEKASAKFYRRNKFDMTCVRFCPHMDNRHQFAAASGQSYEIYIMQPNGIQMLGAGRAHSRNITDLDWDRHNSYQFATCSVDDSVHIWDVRDFKKPALSLNVIAGSFQIKFCKRLQHIFATAHEGDIRLWDARKTTMPIQFIAAHLSKVLSFDWNNKNDVSFVSSSLDKTVKVFDFTKPKEPEICFTSPTPVWKAKFASFGDAILTTPFPQFGHIEHTVTLWNVNECPVSIVHTFSGHNDLILDFCLRKVCSNNEDEEDAIQLYTLSKDNALRLWTIDSKLQSLCAGKSVGSAVASASSAAGFLLSPCDVMPLDRHDFNYTEFVENFERIMATSSSLTTSFKQQQQQNEQNEESAPQSSFSINKSDGSTVDWDRELATLLQLKSIPTVKFEDIDRSSKSFIVSVDHRRFIVKLKIFLPKESMPPGQPERTELYVKFSRDSNLPSGVKFKVLKNFQDICLQKHANEDSILEACLRKLPKCLEQCLSESESSDTQPSTASPNAVVSLSEQLFAFVNSRVPFPATCGARFCSAGILVCFARTNGQLASPSASFEGVSPRTYADLYSREINAQLLVQQTHSGGYFSGVASKDPYDLKNFYYPNRDLLTRKKHRIDSTSGLRYGIDQIGDGNESFTDILVYNVSNLFPYVKTLAKLCKLINGDISETCLFNANVASHIGRNDLTKLWRLVARCTEKNSADEFQTPWALLPFGRKLINHFIEHYCLCGDIQTAAILCCVLGLKTRNSSPKIAHRNITTTDFMGSSSTYNTVHSTYGLREALSGPLQRQRTGSFTEDIDVCGLNGVHDSLSTILEHSGNSTSGNGFLNRKDSKAYEDAKIRENDSRLLDPTMMEKYERIKQAYADLLFRWGLLNERAEILQYCCKPPARSRGPEYWTSCKSCGAECKAAVCSKCKTYAMVCTICKAPVRGLTSACILCAHGGHTRHLIDWFREHAKCPSGCGCTCSLA